jgi:predicted MFS family arabinose efflux permease
VVGYAHSFSDAAFIIQWHVLAMFAPSFVTGSLIKRFGALRIIASGAVLMLLCVIINLQGTGLLYFTVALVALGVGWNFMFVGGTSLLTTTATRSEQAKVQGLNEFLMFGAVALASLSSGALHQSLGWAAVNLGAVPAVAAALAAALWLWLGRVPKAA